MSSRSETPLATGTSHGGKAPHDSVVGSPEPVYRFYLSPPPPAPMQPGAAAYPQQQTMYQPQLGLVPYSPYMPLSPPSMGGVSAFAQPGYYAPHQHQPQHQHQQPQHQQHQQHQNMYYPQPAYAMPALAGVQPRVSTLSTLSSSNGTTPSHVVTDGTRSSGGQAQNIQYQQQQQQQQQAETVPGVSYGMPHEHELVRTKTPIVNEAGVPVGGFGADQDGQYIEIKFPTFGQAQMQQMLQQLHIHQQTQLAQAAAAVCSSPCGIHQPQPMTAAPSMQTVVATVVADSPLPEQKLQQQQQQLPTPISTTPVAPTAPAAVPSDKASVSIYDAETFASTHMEDIVFDNKAFFWKIGNWDKLERRATSDVFRCGGHIWRILLRPFGSSHKGVLSLFLECLGTSDTSDDWRCTCRFVLAIANPNDPSHNTHGSAYHCFHRNNPNWGFTRFMKLADLRTASAPGVRPYIEDGACTISAYLHVIKEPSQ
ncbi:ubiquitin-specific protease ubp15 [Coemansia sp. S146]|nr:ubiquitin-specific protease ubp15 [Coemansia sp. S146]